MIERMIAMRKAFSSIFPLSIGTFTNILGENEIYVVMLTADEEWLRIASPLAIAVIHIIFAKQPTKRTLFIYLFLVDEVFHALLE